MSARVLKAARDAGRHDVAGHANNEQAAEFRIENQLRRDPGIAAAEDRRKRPLALGETGKHLFVYT
jgi:hypothetical protein